MSESFSPSGWFETLFGFRESVREVYADFTVTEFDDHAELTSKVNGRTFNAGRFTVRNIPSFPTYAPVGGGKLHVIRGNGLSGKDNIVDVLLAQSNKLFDGATFLAASNFNCLEFVGMSQTAADGVTQYCGDATQGPYCALAAGAATVYRNYFMKHESGKQGQLEEEVHLLRATPLDPFVKHGYPRLTARELASIAKHDWDDLDQFYVGVHENCEVTTTRSRRRLFKLAPPERIVHQVYAAALNFGGSVAQCEDSIRIGGQILTAEYRATVLAAWELSRKYPGRKGSNRLVLTFLGGGVFGNPRDMICKAIIESKDVIVQSGLEVGRRGILT
jgi:hypothetical protein